MAMVEAGDVTAVLGDTPVLAPTCLRAEPGTVTALVGPNGAGKTTLLRLLAGALTPATGSVHVDGRVADERDPAFRATVASLIGPPPLAHHLTLAEHLSLIGLSWGLRADDGRRRGLDVLDRFGVPGLGERFPHELSSGQTQVLALALTLVRPFEVLLLDEPEQRLDTSRARVLGEVLTDLRDAGTTVIAATHSSALSADLGAELVQLTAVPGPDAG